MEATLIYFAKVALSASVFYLAFLVLFQNQKHFVFNRLYLPVSLLFSFVIPLITFTTIRYVEPTPLVVSENLTGTVILPEVNTQPALLITWVHYAFGIYVLGFLGFVFHLILGHVKAIQIVRKSTIQKLFKKQVNITKKDVHPFSFFNKIVLSNLTLTHPNLEIIVEHENIHVKEKHTIDILISEILFLFQWFNPFAWLIKDAIKNNLEYKTDSVIAQKYDPQSYQLAMVSLADKKGLAPFLTALNGNQLKNRIVMMKKKTENKYNLLKQLLVLPILALLVMGLSNKVERTELIQNEQQISDSKKSKKVYYRVIIDGEEIPTNTPEMQELNLADVLDVPATSNLIKMQNKISSEILKVQNIDPTKRDGTHYSGRHPDVSTLFIKTKDYVEGTYPEFEKQMNRDSVRVIMDNYIKDRIAEEYSGNGTYENSDWKISGSFNAVVDRDIKEVVFTPKTKKGIFLELGGDKSKLPLLILDGAETKSIRHLNPQSIESITVLKDESSLVMYGEKGKNGVILIQTKNNNKVETSDVIKIRNTTTENTDSVFLIVDEMPEFPGGKTALKKYISNATKYPEIAKENGIQGKVYVKFIVDKNGEVNNPKIAKGVDPSLDKEALRVVHSLPNWKPGKQNGKPVNVSYTVPITFGSPEKIEIPKGLEPLIFIDGKESDISIENLDPETIESVTVFKGEKALEKYGEKGKNGVIEITLKSKTFEAEQKFRELITKEIKYPEEALKAYIEKDIYFSLRIDQNGNLHRDAFVPEIDIQQIVVIGERIETNETMTKKAKSEVERVEFFSKEFNRVVGEIKQVDLEELKGKSLRVNVSFKIKEENGYVEINSKKSQPITNEMELRKFFAKRIKYPYDAVENGIVGKISVSVTIDKNGNIVETGKSNIENENVGEVVVTAMIGENKSLTQDDESEILRKEVLRVIKLIPVLDISEFKGKTVNLIVKFNLAE